jgi:hypothetical protein
MKEVPVVVAVPGGYTRRYEPGESAVGGENLREISWSQIGGIAMFGERVDTSGGVLPGGAAGDHEGTATLGIRMVGS